MGSVRGASHSLQKIKNLQSLNHLQEVLEHGVTSNDNGMHLHVLAFSKK